jgi:hypothetical protein
VGGGELGQSAWILILPIKSGQGGGGAAGFTYRDEMTSEPPPWGVEVTWSAPEIEIERLAGDRETAW